MLDPRRLRVLCEVARVGSFSAAAASLGYTQPAISRQIATLEAEVGAMLVRRVPQGVVLTEAGRLLAQRGETVIARLRDIELELQALTGLEGGRLRLGSFASAAAAILPPAVACFRARYPAVELTVISSDPIDSIPRLRSGELDLALSHDALGAALPPGGSVSIAASDGSGAVELVHLFDDPMYVALPSGHRLSATEPLALNALAGEPWMLATSQSCPDSRLFLGACRAAGFEPQIAFQNDDYQAILGFVAAGVGVALVPDMVLRGLRDGVLIRVLDPPAPPRPICAAFPAGYRSPPAAAMLEVLQEVAQDWMSDRADLAQR
ncbi:MAG: LysR family transcriptional regulator [Solirubrobacteraceae bacterium]